MLHENKNVSSKISTDFYSVVVLISIFALRCDLSNNQAYSCVNGHTLF